MTIRDEKELSKAHEALGNLYRALSTLREEYGEKNPKAFAMLAEGPLQEIRRLTTEIEEYTGAHQVEAEEAQLWLGLKGERAQWKETPTSVLTAFLDALRKGVQAIAGFNVTGRISGRPSLDLQRLCDFELVALHPGSLRIGMRLPETKQQELFKEGQRDEAHVALQEYLQTAKWISSNESKEVLSNFFTDPIKRRIVLRAVKPLIPRIGGGIDTLELYGAEVPKREKITLIHAATERVTEALEEAVAENEERYEGDVREMDLDRQSFKLRNVPEVGEVSCKLSEDIGPIAPTYLGKRAKVIGIRKDPNRPLDVVDIELLEPQRGNKK